MVIMYLQHVQMKQLLIKLIGSKSEHEAEEYLGEFRGYFPNSWSVFHPSVGLIVWWPYRDFHLSPMPHVLSHMASTIYHFNHDSCYKTKDRNGIDFTTPKEVGVLQALLS